MGDQPFLETVRIGVLFRNVIALQKKPEGHEVGSEQYRDK